MRRGKSIYVERLQIRLTTAEYGDLAKVAEDIDKPMSRVARQSIREYLERYNAKAK